MESGHSELHEIEHGSDHGEEIGNGIALVRLRKPLAYYAEKYGTLLWGFNQLFLLMEKQHNRGQDGAGIGSMKLNMPPGEAFMFRERSTSSRRCPKYSVATQAIGQDDRFRYGLPSFLIP